MPISIRYTDIRNGGIVMTGNTLGLSKSANANAPGQLGSIGARIAQMYLMDVLFSELCRRNLDQCRQSRARIADALAEKHM